MTRQLTTRRDLLKSTALLGVGLAIGAIWRQERGVSLAADGTPDATATRQAELDELHALQTQVANPPVCTPAPTETPMPPTPTPTTIPAIPAKTPVMYLDYWTVTVVSISPTLGGEIQPEGQFMQVNLTLKHSEASSQPSPLPDFQLIDGQGRRSGFDVMVNQELLGTGNGLPVPVGVEENRSIVFDVAVDAGTAFILESSKDPLFRIALDVEIRG